MSNHVSIIPTKFEDVRTGDVSYGVRIYDTFDSCYDNSWETIPDDDLDVLRRVLECDYEEVKGLLVYLREHSQGVEIGDRWYDWEQIEDVLNEDLR